MHAERRRLLLQGAADAGLDAVAVVPGPNLLYLTGLGFHLSERPVILFLAPGADAHIVLPALEAPKVAGADFSLRAFDYDDDAGPARAVAAALEALGLPGRRCGVEDRRMRFLEMDLMARSRVGPDLLGADQVFARLRARKDDAEIAAMERAVAVAEEALGAVLPEIRAGLTERDIASRLTAALLGAGSDPQLPFFPIVAAGPNGALPHALPTDRPLAGGDFVVVDWGARYGGYCSDITRTFVVAGGEVSAPLARAYEAVRGANVAARGAARPGASGRDVDRAARQVIVDAGFGDRFIHRTGHGLGLEAHEEPDMKHANLAPLAAGTTFTVEPGVYLPGVGGVRIEDDVVITPSGSRSLTTLDRALVTVG